MSCCVCVCLGKITD